MSNVQETIPETVEDINPIEEEAPQEPSKGDTEEMHPYDLEIARNSLELSNT